MYTLCISFQTVVQKQFHHKDLSQYKKGNKIYIYGFVVCSVMPLVGRFDTKGHSHIIMKAYLKLFV